MDLKDVHLNQRQQAVRAVNSQHGLVAPGVDEPHGVAHAHPGVFGEETLPALPLRTTDQTEHASGDMREYAVAHAAVEIRKRLLGNPIFLPQHTIGMRERDF